MVRPGNALALAAVLLLRRHVLRAAAQEDLRGVLQRAADGMAAKYNMSVAIAAHSPRFRAAAAAGFIDAGLGLGAPARRASPDDAYVWGSTTKMFTAPAVLQLVERGAVRLTDPVSEHTDAILSHLGGRTLAAHFGEGIRHVQVQHVLRMQSGIPDYDNGNYTMDQFRERSRAFGPVEIMFKYVSPRLEFHPGSQTRYCSTNYVLLGLLLAQHYHKNGTGWSWEAYDQAAIFPAALRKAFPQSKFVTAGPCKLHTPVHGFMESYPGVSLPSQDVWDVSCVGGWTAGNYVGPVAEVASFTHALYNKQAPGVVSAASQKLLTNFTGFPGMPKFYGMGTFSLDWSVGGAEAYGHVGDTYGYQSQTTYFPGLDFVLSVATNVETTTQAQPADATCVAYNALVAAWSGAAAPSCEFKVFGRFLGRCLCSTLLVV
uniref:Beta-lactamase-related domain-containing protein n=1 Tax=Zooxanthella nutricula TaxID=1333877 RepID=A0A6U6KSB7_9DINO